MKTPALFLLATLTAGTTTCLAAPIPTPRTAPTAPTSSSDDAKPTGPTNEALRLEVGNALKAAHESLERVHYICTVESSGAKNDRTPAYTAQSETEVWIDGDFVSATVALEQDYDEPHQGMMVREATRHAVLNNAYAAIDYSLTRHIAVYEHHADGTHQETVRGRMQITLTANVKDQMFGSAEYPVYASMLEPWPNSFWTVETLEPGEGSGGGPDRTSPLIRLEMWGNAQIEGLPELDLPWLRMRMDVDPARGYQMVRKTLYKATGELMMAGSQTLGSIPPTGDEPAFWYPTEITWRWYGLPRGLDEEEAQANGLEPDENGNYVRRTETMRCTVFERPDSIDHWRFTLDAFNLAPGEKVIVMPPEGYGEEVAWDEY